METFFGHIEYLVYNLLSAVAIDHTIDDANSSGPSPSALLLLTTPAALARKRDHENYIPKVSHNTNGQRPLRKLILEPPKQIPLGNKLAAASVMPKNDIRCTSRAVP